MTDQIAAANRPGSLIDPATAGAVVNDAIDRYFDSRRALVDGFVTRNFGFRGSAALHRHALGPDLVRAPVNVALVPAQLGLHVAGMVAGGLGARRAGHWLKARRILLRTDVDRELEWRLWSELLELPYADGDRVCGRDAIAEAMMADVRLHRALAEPLAEIARHAGDPEIRRRIEETVAIYTGTRAAAADIVGALVNAGTGYLAAQQITPSVWTLGPVLAAAVAHHMAISGFPLGATAGGLWYGLFPATATTWMTVSAMAGVATVGALVAAFAGVLADPVQRAVGLHRRRLDRMLDVLQRNFRGEGPVAFSPRDHYVARLVELVDLVRAAQRVVQSGG